MFRFLLAYVASICLPLPIAAQSAAGAARTSTAQEAAAPDQTAWQEAARSRYSDGAWERAIQSGRIDSWSTGTALYLPGSAHHAPDPTLADIPDSDSPLVDFAATLVGRRYRYGSSRGEFDCSGLVKHVFAEFGVELPRSSRQQFRVGHRIGRDELQAGDLVFFSSGRSGVISHVGIYAGDDLFVHAARRAGRVRVSSLSEAYFAARYAGARRVCSAPAVNC